ncbi:MAG: hypothetical protein GY953_00370, partial [bacterium]|nr:hypothetical protein [bacterium]
MNGVPCDYAMNEACSAGTGSFLEEAAKAFDQAHGWWTKWRRMLSPRAQFVLLWERLRGRLLYGGHARFAWLSTARLVLNIWVLVSAAGLYAWWIYDLDQRAEAIANSFDTNRRLSPEDQRSLWELAGESYSVRRRVLERLLSGGRSTERFRAHEEEILHAAAGLNARMRRDLVDQVLRQRCYESLPEDANVRLACANSAVALDRDAEQVGSLLAASMEKTTASDELRSLGAGLVALGERLAADEAERAAERILAVMEKTTDPYALNSLIMSLRALGEQPGVKEAERIAALTLAALEKETDFFRLLKLGECLRALEEWLEAPAAERFAARILAAMENTTDPIVLSALGLNLRGLGKRLGAPA